MFKRIVTSALVFGTIALASPLNAQASLNCQEREKLVQTLETRYNETLISAGLQGPEQLLEVWSAQDTGSFTILITKPNGISCVVASGKNWISYDFPVDLGIAG